MNQVLNIAILGEELFKYGAAVALYSAAKCCTAERLRVFILDVNLKRKTRTALVETVRQSGRKADVEFLSADDSEAFRAMMAIQEAVSSQAVRFVKKCCRQWF